MTTSKLLAQALDLQDLGVRRAFMRLEDHEKAEIEVAYRRHVDACNKCDCGPDPAFIREAVHDLLFVPPGEREAMAVGAR